jgi:hypothetical protein
VSAELATSLAIDRVDKMLAFFTGLLTATDPHDPRREVVEELHESAVLLRGQLLMFLSESTTRA